MRPPRSVREDVHIHARPDAVFALLSSSDADWLPPAFEAYEVDDRDLAFTLALPFRREPARLTRTSMQPPWVLQFAGDNSASGVTALEWVVNAESATEVHVEAQLVYLPASGPLGWALEEMLQRPARQQAMRDALWRLKLVAEGKRPEPE